MLWDCEGMMLGISHACVEIISRCLQRDFCKLARSLQDLFYNLKAFEYYVKNYPKKISDLRYLVLEIYDYTYFDYDVSKSKHAAE